MRLPACSWHRLGSWLGALPSDHRNVEAVKISTAQSGGPHLLRQLQGHRNSEVLASLEVFAAEVMPMFRG